MSSISLSETTVTPDAAPSGFSQPSITEVAPRFGVGEGIGGWWELVGGEVIEGLTVSSGSVSVAMGSSVDGIPEPNPEKSCATVYPNLDVTSNAISTEYT